MPSGPQHEKQRKKNIALFFILLGLIATIYAIALMRMGFSFS